MTELQLNTFSKRCLELLGDEWCPYPSNYFLEVCAKVSDEDFRFLVIERRKYRAPSFFSNEPMQKILNEYNQKEVVS